MVNNYVPFDGKREAFYLNIGFLVALTFVVLGMSFEVGSILALVYYAFMALLFFFSKMTKPMMVKVVLFTIAFILLFVSPYMFDLEMEQFEEIFMILPIVFVIIFPGNFLINLVNVLLISMYFVYSGDEVINGLIEDSIEILIIGFLAIMVSDQFNKFKDKMIELNYSSSFDWTCNIRNKVVLLKILKEVDDTENEFDLFVIEMKDYKLIRDYFGYSHSNKLLHHLIEKANLQLKSNEEIFRTGPEEFVLLVINPHRHYGYEDFEAFFKNPILLDGYTHNIDFYIGAARYPKDGNISSEYYNLGSTALRNCKSISENTLLDYDYQMRIDTLKRFELIDEIKKGLKRKEFIPFYQPKISIKSNQVVGLEALARWNHPYKGLRYPVEFIEVCESTGLIVELGYQILRKACLDYEELSRVYGEFVVSVNLSASQLKDKRLVENIEEILVETNMLPQNLELEITESALIDNLSYNIKTINDFKNIGIKLSMDDFGVEYSSFSYLKNLPIDTLKLDRLFVRDFEHNKNDIAIIKSMIQLGHELNLNVIAEGVETQEQLDVLRELECDQYQGYYHSQPMAKEKIIERVKNEGIL
jgi:EAL domain-containing protein (putative c-di-GMP-specific phosphodiesterase class I)/GGDEF domain-containing protein